MPVQPKPPGGGKGRKPINPPSGGGSSGGYEKGKVYQIGNGYYTWDGTHWVPVGGGGGGGGGSISGGYGGFGGGFGGFALTTTTGRKLSQAQVDALKADFRHIANIYGVNLSGAAALHLVKMDLSTSEVLQRVQVIQHIKENAIFFHQFSNTLMAKGITHKPLTKQEIRNFVLGTAPPKFYGAWEEASTRAGLVSAGLRIGKPNLGGDLTVGEKFLHQLMGALGRDRTLSGSPTVQETYAKIASDIMDVLPESRFQDFGLTKKDFIELEAGGKHSLTLAQKVRQIQANVAARGNEARPFQQQQQDTGYTTSTA